VFSVAVETENPLGQPAIGCSEETLHVVLSRLLR
jgi:hypothetical protein